MLSLPGEFGLGNIAGIDVFLSEALGEFNLVRDRRRFEVEATGQKRQAVSGNIFEISPIEFVEHTGLEIDHALSMKAGGVSVFFG